MTLIQVKKTRQYNIANSKRAKRLSIIAKKTLMYSTNKPKQSEEKITCIILYER